MAVNGINQAPGSSLDVASIVSQLMEVERKPIDKLQNKIERADIKITALGSFQGKLSALKDALDGLQNPANFTTRTLSNSQPGLVTAAASASALPGQYDVHVQQLAQSALVHLDAAGQEYQFTFGNTVLASPAGLTTLTQLQDWFNASSLKDNFRATVVEAAGGAQVLTIQGLQTGAAQQIQVGMKSGATWSAVANQRAAQDALFSVNGISLQRDSNSVTAMGFNLELLTPSATNADVAVVHVRNQAVDSQPRLQTLVDAYNALLGEYKTLTQSSVVASERGVLNSDTTLSTLMRQVTDLLGAGCTFGTNNSLGLAALGLEFAQDGKLVMNPALAVGAADLNRALSAGVRFGASSADHLSLRIQDALAFGGLLTQRIGSEKTTQSDLAKRQASLEEKMVSLQARYTAQYAALDALLFKLNNTSNALKSALDAMTASQKD